MEKRTISAYRAVFSLLKDVCPNLDPRVILTDWERAQQAAWQEAFPSECLYNHFFYLLYMHVS